MPYTISIVTYHARFETYFKPLIRNLVRIFPDREIICILNGHPDRTLQMRYLAAATDFLRTIPNVRYLTYDQHQSLAKCWNQVMILSHTEHVLMLNDDTQVSDLFRREIESHIGTYEFTTINHSWSHFVITKSLMRRVGWFDERFLGIGHEDGDYGYRMAMQNIPIHNESAHGIRNFVAPATDAGYQSVSKPSAGSKYAAVNEEMFTAKWHTPMNSPHLQTFEYTCVFTDITYPFTPVAGMETPEFYDRTLLASLHDNHRNVRGQHRPRHLRILIEKVYFSVGRTVIRTLRRIRTYTQA